MIFKSPSPTIDIPEISWGEYFFNRIESYHDTPALIDGESGKVTTFDELKDQIRSAACALQQKGFQKGDVFAVYAPNSPEYVVAFQAVVLLGGVVTTANPLYTINELAHQLYHSKAVCLFTTPELLEKAEPDLESSNIREVFVFGDPGHENSFNSLLKDQSPDRDFEPAKIKPNQDIAVLPYSSGTTGLPKGVMLSHRNLVAHNMQIEGQVDATTPTEGNRLVAVLPFFHIFGMTANMNLGLTNGSTLVILNRFDPPQFLQVIQQHRVTDAYLVPPIILFLGSHPLVDQFDVSSLKYILSGAAPMAKDQAIAVSERLGCPVYQGYGLTETSPVTHRVPDLVPSSRYGSIGMLVPNTEARIIDVDTGKDLGFNERGEILIRGPQVMLGYLDNPQATADTIDEGGWLHTGDVAYVDEEGYFYIVDRLKELIKYKGYQVPPAELEGLLLTHPAVLDAAVIPIPDPEAGEVPKAFIVVKEEISAQDLMEWVAERVAPYKKIREVRFIDKIPKSPTGKILRRLLSEI